MVLKLPFSRGVDLPLDVPQLSEEGSICMNLKLPFSRKIDLSPDLPRLSE